MKRKLFFLYFLHVFFLNTQHYFAQVLFYQDNCHCGVTGAGFSTLMAGGSDTLKVHIAPGSAIRKAFLFGTEYWNNSLPFIDFNITLGDTNFTFNSQSRISAFNASNLSTAPNIYIHSLDVTQSIDSIDSTFLIGIPNVSECFGCIFSTVYVYILYENPNLDLTSSYILINNQDEQYSSDFLLTHMNEITSSSDVGWAICASRISEWTPGDGSFLSFNNEGFNAGLLEGEGNLTSDGPQGCFYFENDELFGLSNDTPDYYVNGYDALINCENLVNPNHSLNWTLSWEMNAPSPPYNIYNEFFIEHGTTCETSQVSTINDTTICANSPVQLYATGGIAYEWSPSENLSCSNCANPIFVSDTSALLTVRIWSSDSCSVVRPVKVNVLEIPELIDLELTGSICGNNSGEIQIKASASALPLSYQLDNMPQQLSGNFEKISAGNHLLSIIDQNHCALDTSIFIETLHQTNAQFQLSSQLLPLSETLYIENVSTNANNFTWSVNDQSQSTVLHQIIFDTAGIYNIQLIAYQYDASCADTFALNVIVLNEILCTIPNIITPNADQINDYFSIDVNLEVESNISILDRNGNQLYQFKGKLNPGSNNIWDAKVNGHQVDESAYFYHITLHYQGNPTLKQPVLTKSYHGFFHIAY